MITLTIDGKPAALPADFSFDMAIENPFFTDASEYTGEVELSPKAIENIRIFGHVGRFDKTKKQQVKDCELSNDGVVLLSGKATTIEYTPDALSVQLLGGNSSVNFLIRWEEMYIDEMSLGKLNSDWTSIFPTSTDNRTLEPFARRIMGEPESQEWVMLPCKNAAGMEINNIERWFPDRTNSKLEYGWPYATYSGNMWALQPRIIAIVRRVIQALGYTIDVFDAAHTPLKYLYYVNVRETLYLNEMLPHWSVSKFLKEIQNLLGCVFIFDPANKVCSIKSRQNFFDNDTVNLEMVDDAFIVDIEEDNYTDLSNVNLNFNVSDYPIERLFGEEANQQCEFREFATMAAAESALHSGSTNLVAVVNGHHYIMRRRDTENSVSFNVEEVNDLGAEYKDEVENEISLNFVPAEMGVTMAWSTQLEGAGNLHRVGWMPTPSPIGTAPQHKKTYFDINTYLDKKEEDNGDDDELQQMRIAFFTSWDKLPEIDMMVTNSSGEWDGTYTQYCKTKLWCGWVYMVDDVSYDKMQMSSVVYTDYLKFDPCCSLRHIGDYDTLWNLGVGAAQSIDTTAPHQITFYDDIDLKDINKTYIIRGHKYVCQKIEVTVTHNGIGKAKTGTFYQID